MRKTILIIFCILLPLFLLLFSYKSTLFFIDKDANQKNTINFLNNNEELTLNYTAAEISHLEDVKVVMKYADYLFYILLLVLTLTFTYYKKEQKRLLYYGGLTTIICLVLLLGLTIVFFDQTFTLFHNIFFSQGNWRFAPDSLLITTFPIEFFMKISRLIFIQTLFFGTLIVILSKVYRKGF